MSQLVSPSVIKREAEGIGRLHAAGYGPDHWVIQRLPGRGIPPRQPWSYPSCELEDEYLTVTQLAGALCVRVKTVRDYLREADLAPVPTSETKRQMREAVRARKAGELSKDEYDDLVDDLVYRADGDGPHLVDCGELALWVFSQGKHRLRHRWTWWWVEWALDTWTLEEGYIDAPPMTRGEWRDAHPGGGSQGISKFCISVV